jgi:hypothetical protein
MKPDEVSQVVQERCAKFAEPAGNAEDSCFLRLGTRRNGVLPGKEYTPAPAADDLNQVQGKVVSVKFTAIK